MDQQGTDRMSIKLLAAFLFLVSFYIASWSISHSTWLWLMPSLIAITDAVGLLLRKRWSAYLWYAIALTVVVSWSFFIGQLLFSGWPRESTLRIAISLIPGISLLAVCVGGSVAVRKHILKGFCDDLQ